MTADAAPSSFEDVAETLSGPLRRYFERTVLTARVHHAAAASYFGFRVWARGGEHRTPSVARTVRDGLKEMLVVAEEIENFPVTPALGQWKWPRDAERARRYYRWIVEEGWPEETDGFRNSYGGMTFPLD